MRADKPDFPVAPSRGRGLKHPVISVLPFYFRRPFTGAWIETRPVHAVRRRNRVAPSRGRGLKLRKVDRYYKRACRPFTGAWIETLPATKPWLLDSVAPSRGRGLKLIFLECLRPGPRVAPSRGRGLKHRTDCPSQRPTGRPFTGAWIETLISATPDADRICRPFTGAWIETGKYTGNVPRIESPLHGGVD